MVTYFLDDKRIKVKPTKLYLIFCPYFFEFYGLFQARTTLRMRRKKEGEAFE